jgi:hypothetical protein
MHPSKNSEAWFEEADSPEELSVGLGKVLVVGLFRVKWGGAWR